MNNPGEEHFKEINWHFIKNELQIANKHLKRVSTLLIIKKLQMKKQPKCHSHSQISKTYGEIRTHLHFAAYELVETSLKAIWQYVYQNYTQNVHILLPCNSIAKNYHTAQMSKDIYIMMFITVLFVISKG